MSTITRRGLQIIAECLGRARQAVVTPVGNTSRIPGAQLKLESALCRLRTATVFHDTDSSSSMLQFDELDPVGLGIQGGVFSMESDSASAFSSVGSGGHWTPFYYGPPCPEGWQYWNYNAWAGWIPVDGNGDPLYTVNMSEPTGGSERLEKNHPIRWNGSDYVRVPFFESARWLSFKNTTGSALDNAARVEFELDASLLEGIQSTDHLTDVPLDICFYSHADLIQTYSSNAWQELASSPSAYDELEALGYEIEKTSSGWKFRINVPSDASFSWPASQWWHVAVYWGSRDAMPSATAGSATPFAPAGNAIYTWPRKNFFRTDIYDTLAWTKTGINDSSSQYLTAWDRTHFNFKDGEYSDPGIPVRYSLPDMLPSADVRGLANSLTGYAAPEKSEAVGVVLCAKTQGTAYETPNAEYAWVVGPSVPSELWPSEWSEFDFYPLPPSDYVTVAKIVLKRAPGAVYGLVEGSTSGKGSIVAADKETASVHNILATSAVVWIDQAISTYAQPPHGDPDLASLLIPEATKAATFLRTLDIGYPMRLAAYDMLLPAARFPSTLAAGTASLSDSTQLPSKVLHNLLKKPIDTALQNPENEPPRAVPFDHDGRELIADLSGTPPSTELARLDVDKLYLTGERLSTPAKFELYMEPSDQCQAIDPNASGISLGQDYTLRLKLEDASENVLTKDLYVMASRFFLSNAEYARRDAAGQTNVGYFKRGTSAEQESHSVGTLETIPEWRLHGYAGLIPDLTMDEARQIRTRVVSPADDTRETEEQFRKRLANQGYSDEQINDAVQEFLDNGGEFLVIDLNQYPEEWTAVRELAVSVAQYAYTDTPYWKINLNPYFGYANDVADDAAPSVAEVRADSFTVAPAGLSAGDLENFGSQAVAALDPSINYTTGGTDGAFDSLFVAFKVVTTERTYASSVASRFKVVYDTGRTSLANGSVSSITPRVYTDNDGMPGQRVASGNSVLLENIGTSYADTVFALPYEYAADTTYWLVYELSAAPVGGTIYYERSNISDQWIAIPDADAIWSLAAGRGWIKFYQVEAEALGAFNRNTLSNLPPANTLREKSPVYRVDGYWSYTCQKLDVPQQLAVYPRAFNDGSTWRYARFANDVHLCVRYLVNGDVRTFTHSFTKAPSWRAQWWQRSSADYNVLNTAASPAVDEIVNTIDYASASADGQTEYINAKLDGSFTPRYSEAYTLTVTSDSGVRVYLDGALVIDQWLNASTNAFTYTTATLSNAVPITLSVEYYHATGTQQLKLEWQSATQTIGLVGPVTSVDPDPEPVLIDSDNTQGIVYLAVGKTADELDTPTYGAPPSDRLVIRSV